MRKRVAPKLIGQLQSTEQQGEITQAVVISPKQPRQKRPQRRFVKHWPNGFNHKEYFAARVRSGRCRECDRLRNWTAPLEAARYAYRCELCEQRRIAWVKKHYHRNSRSGFVEAAAGVIKRAERRLKNGKKWAN